MKRFVLMLLLFTLSVPVFAKDGLVVGISNGWVGSEWRTQMVDDVLDIVMKDYTKNKIVKDVIVQSTDVSLEGQIDQVRNLMASGCDIILINAGDAKAFNPVFLEAKKRGVIVVATDTEVSSKHAVNVCIDQKEWAMTSAEWLAEKLGGKGNIVCVNGITGHPANTARIAGYKEVFKKYPDIKILNEVEGGWDNAKGMAAVQNLLATYPDIDGIWVQDGMTEGALVAVEAADKLGKIAVTGEARNGFLSRWVNIEDEKFESICVANPPGCMASALRVAILLAQGKKINKSILSGPYGNSIYIPIPMVVTKENFKEVYEEYKDKASYYSLDGIISEELAESYFEK